MDEIQTLRIVFSQKDRVPFRILLLGVKPSDSFYKGGFSRAGEALNDKGAYLFTQV